MKKEKQKKSYGSVVMRIAVYLFLTGLAFVFLYPFLTMLVDSVKTYADISNNTIKWIPRNFTLNNYKLAFSALNAWRTGANSLIVTVAATLGHMLSCSLSLSAAQRYVRNSDIIHSYSHADNYHSVIYNLHQYAYSRHTPAYDNSYVFRLRAARRYFHIPFQAVFFENSQIA